MKDAPAFPKTLPDPAVPRLPLSLLGTPGLLTPSAANPFPDLGPLTARLDDIEQKVSRDARAVQTGVSPLAPRPLAVPQALPQAPAVRPLPQSLSPQAISAEAGNVPVAPPSIALAPPPVTVPPALPASLPMPQSASVTTPPASIASPKDDKETIIRQFASVPTTLPGTLRLPASLPIVAPAVAHAPKALPTAVSPTAPGPVPAQMSPQSAHAKQILGQLPPAVPQYLPGIGTPVAAQNPSQSGDNGQGDLAGMLQSLLTAIRGMKPDPGNEPTRKGAAPPPPPGDGDRWGLSAIFGPPFQGGRP